MVVARPALVAADSEARLRHIGLLLFAVAWLLYTRFFWTARDLHATLPACPLLTLTGHPCPFCGGTRSFAYMWQGDMTRAALLYPLGPVLFYGTFAALPVLALGALTGRDVRVPLRWQWALMAAIAVVLAASWALKLTVLPN